MRQSNNTVVGPKITFTDNSIFINDMPARYKELMKLWKCLGPTVEIQGSTPFKNPPLTLKNLTDDLFDVLMRHLG